MYLLDVTIGLLNRVLLVSDRTIGTINRTSSTSFRTLYFNRYWNRFTNRYTDVLKDIATVLKDTAYIRGEMESVSIDKINSERSIKTIGIINLIKLFRQKLTKVISLDADPIFKSKDWPHLWPK